MRTAPSVSFPPPAPPTGGSPSLTEGSLPVPVGPGRPAFAAPRLVPRALGVDVSGYPVQISKVQRPPLPDQNLMRERLLDWLERKVHSRVVLVVAEAGYGKTTLLTQFSKRTRRRVLWYRLDAGDRDWVGFLSYLIAAFRTRFPEFGTATESLLVNVPPTGPALGQTLDLFLRELRALPSEPIVLVLDDVHLADDAPEVRLILRELIARGPERQTIVMASRRVPSVPLARLRSHGEVAELGTDDLRFDAAETSQLLRETYGLPLDSNDVAEVARRTEGWAASLQAVQAALRGRGAHAARQFVEQLGGADGDIYDYLAEEVVGDLPEDLQQFLMRTSVIETITVERASAAAAVGEADARRLIQAAERSGLLSRRSRESRHTMRAHPLVRGFLSARLGREVDSTTIGSIHRAVARAVDGEDWRMAVYHYGRAGDVADVHRVLESSVSHILATGSYATAETVATGLPEASIPRNFAIVRSRSALQRGEMGLAITLADEALRGDESSELATFNAMSIRLSTSNPLGAVELGRVLGETADDPAIRRMARATRLLVESSTDGSLEEAALVTEKVVEEERLRGHAQYLAVSLLNLAHVRIAQGRIVEALQGATEAIDLLAPSDWTAELGIARLLRAWCLAYEGRLDEARAEAEAGRAPTSNRTLEEVYFSADLETLFGTSERALASLARRPLSIDDQTDDGEQICASLARLALRQGNLAEASAWARRFHVGQLRSVPAFDTVRRLIRSEILLRANDPLAIESAQDARDFAERQGATLWVWYVDVLIASMAGGTRLSHAICAIPTSLIPIASMLAEVVVPEAGRLTAAAQEIVSVEASARPERWRDPLRTVIASEDAAASLFAAKLLDQIGTIGDVALLRQVAKKKKADRSWAGLGRSLAKRIAPRVMIEDLGRIEVLIGDSTVPMNTIRRKVLALLLFLVTRPGLAANRDMVLDTLWPDSEPDVALNSLNQTIYFLRRVFEPAYNEDLSPGYVHHDAETVWLDRDLVRSRSASCRALIRSAGSEPNATDALALAREYSGEFALEFAYEEWSAQYRESLHGSFLRVIEHAVKAQADSGDFGAGIELAQMAVDVAPDSETLHAELLRLYRLAGAHSAAAEQGSRYAALLTSLGISDEAEEG